MASVKTAVLSSPNLSRVFLQLNRNMENIWKLPDDKKGNNFLTLLIKMYILFACTIIASKACASSVFLYRYKNKIFNQSVHIFS